MTIPQLTEWRAIIRHLTVQNEVQRAKANAHRFLVSMQLAPSRQTLEASND